MTQLNTDLYGLKNDGNGWKRVNEEAFWKYVERANPTEFISHGDGFETFNVDFGDVAEGVVVKCTFDKLPPIHDQKLRDFVRGELTRAVAA